MIPLITISPKKENGKTLFGIHEEAFASRLGDNLGGRKTLSPTAE
jgi:hypothetical protein